MRRHIRLYVGVAFLVLPVLIGLANSVMASLPPEEGALPGSGSKADVAPIYGPKPDAPSLLGDLLFSHNVEAATLPPADLSLGVEFALSYFWVTGSSSADGQIKLYKLNTAGNFIGEYPQEPCPLSASGYYDLAFDGVLLYAADECGIDQIDPFLGQKIGDIPTPPGVPLVRALAYDPSTGLFYTGDLNRPITVFDNAGFVVRTLPNPGLSIHGLGWDESSPGGPYLWAWSQNGVDCTNGLCARATRLNPLTGSPTGVQFNGLPVGPGRELAGGATVTDQLGSQITLIGIHKSISSTDTIRGYDLTLGGPTNTGTPTATPTATSTATPTIPSCGPGSNYDVTPAGGSTIVPGTNDTGNHCDDCLTAIALPFPIELYELSLASVNASSNGNLQFQLNNNAFLNGCVPDPALGPSILPHWDDLRTDTPGSGIFTSVSGVAPDRIFNIEWRATYFGSGQPLNFEVRLYENRSRFDIVYGNIPEGGNGATVGVQRGAGPQFTQYSCNTGGLGTSLQLAFTQTACGTSTPTRTPTRTPTITPTALPCGPESNYIALTTSNAAFVPGAALIPGSQCDECVLQIPLPFQYSLYGQPFPDVNIGSNGNLQFIGANFSFANTCLPNSAFYNTIFAHWDDLDMRSVVSPNLGIFTSVSGTAPTRIFNIEWRACLYANDVCGGSVHFVARLYEAQNRFDIIYDTVTNSGSGATVGVQRENGTQFTLFECNMGVLNPGLQLTFTQNSCETPCPPPPTVTGTPPTNTSTITGTPPTKTPTITPTATETTTGATATNTPTPTDCTNYVITTSCEAIVLGTCDVGLHCDDCTIDIALPFLFRLYRGSIPGGNNNTPVSTNSPTNTPDTATSPTINTETRVGTNTPTNTPSGKPPGSGSDSELGWPIIRLGSDGTAQLFSDTADPGSNDNTCLPAKGFAFTVFPHWDDLRTDCGGCGIFTKLDGPPGNEVYYIEWRTEYYSGAGVANFELRIYENDSKFDIIYGQVDDEGNSATIGAQKGYNDGKGPFKQIQCNTGGIFKGLKLSFSLGSLDQMLCGGGSLTPTPTGTPPTPTPTFVPCLTFTPTPSATPTALATVVGHVTWQGIAQPNSRNLGLTGTFTLCDGGVPRDYVITTDAGGFFTVPTGLTPGTYNWRFKGPKHLANSGTVTLVGGTTNMELGVMRAGDVNNNNIVNSSDFSLLRNTFGFTGCPVPNPGWDPRADFNNDCLVNSTDFSLLRSNFGHAGDPVNCP